MSILQIELSGERARTVAKLLGNDTARRIMDAVAEESKSESELAKELEMPLSTVHYNVQKLHKAGLLKSEEYTYSEKGKEVRHYQLASEHVIITAKPSNLAAAISGIVLTGIVAISFAFTRQEAAPQQAALVQRSAESTADMGVLAAEAAPVAQQPEIWPWILLGAAVMLVGMLVAQYVWNRRK